MRLMVLRHGVAVDASEAGGNDAARFLTRDGRRGVRHMAQAMRTWNLIPDAVWSSEWTRARETAEIAVRAFNAPRRIEIQHALEDPPELGPLFELLSRASGLGSLMIVGHNPSLEALIGRLIASPDPAEVKLRKGGLAVLDFAAEVGPGTGVLRGLWSPGEVAALRKR